MKALLYMIRANLKMNVRNRTALFWNLAFPLIFILLFGFIVGNSDLEINVGVAGADSSEIASQVTAAMEDADGLSVSTGSEQEERDALQEGERSVIVVFEPGANPEQVNARLYWDQSNPQVGTVALNTVQQFLSEANQQISGAPRVIDVQVEAVDAESFEYVDFLVPGIVGMSIMNSGIIGLASAFVTYREKGILRRVRATPFPLSSFILARIISQLLIIVLQAGILIGVGMLLFGIEIEGSLPAVFAMVTVGALGFLALGFLVSAFARNQETADSLANGLTIPMLFLSGVFFPVDSAPSWLQPITRIIPLRYLVDGLREIMVRGSTISAEWINVLVLLVTALVGVLLALRFFRWDTAKA